MAADRGHDRTAAGMQRGKCVAQELDQVRTGRCGVVGHGGWGDGSLRIVLVGRWDVTSYRPRVPGRVP